MREFTNLERLKRLQEEANKINKELNEENKDLELEKKKLIEKNIESFLNDLAELSRFGEAGWTDIELTFYFGCNKPILIHRLDGCDFVLKANPSGYGKEPVIYDTRHGWDWYEKECKEFIALNKDDILDAIEKGIVKNMARHISDSNYANKNEELKNHIEQLKNNLSKE